MTDSEFNTRLAKANSVLKEDLGQIAALGSMSGQEFLKISAVIGFAALDILELVAKSHQTGDFKEAFIKGLNEKFPVKGNTEYF